MKPGKFNSNLASLRVAYGFLLAVWCISGSLAETITFYEHAHHSGASINQQVFGSNCVDLPWAWNDKVSSVNTRGNCIIVYEHGGCSGSAEAMYPGTHHYDLEATGWNDKISSFRLCN